MTEAFRNLTRRKLRTSLTIFGITIGIFALAVMGSLSEYLNTTIESGLRYSGDIIRVLPKRSTFPGSGTVPESLGNDLKTVANVKAISGGITLPADPNSQPNAVSFGSPKFFMGVDPSIMPEIFINLSLSEGRMLSSGDETAVVIGHDVAVQGNFGIGSIKNVYNTNFTVVGVLKPTQSAGIDGMIVAPLPTVQRIQKTPGIVNFFLVVPDRPENAQAVADEISRHFKDDFSVMSPGEIRKQVAQGSLIFNIIILAGAALAAVVGGLSTINTMIMSVAERTREIGIKKAVGASHGQIVREFLTESALIGFLGGLMGISLAKIATIFINQFTSNNAGGLEIFSLTPRLALLALAF
ncbi:MAG TPA: ABC transporter permease, partial [Patescibacteria group bacterium]|nr:ABC transporter permease [Patescibacteria group bacterium]